ncbi:hypothetical protein A2415_02430 [candidate division WWE3 bacterium RIFOXYC1_FULL_39_7]|uniref:N-acetyltransferase domain-containing protein n=2 Tax=Katanobacteria TaxID=422282 RepID=A0A1F4X943_UNCKA|nr:MAG: hypothetical protein A2415_02430 [candidate division WWE3 bacterium RIFOXYC1_FULL_39_7]OGC77573.1 MAG: hypothetical protein A2619_01035 [candidate division WWE3 bacterium RIFOXYD1_FULL_39_9]
MEVKKITSLDYPEWDKFVDSSDNGTIFHKLHFLKYHPENRFDFHNLAFYDDNKLIAVLPGGVKDGVFKSPMGASYGSFAMPDLTLEKQEGVIDAFLEYAKQMDFREIYLTPPPVVYYKTQNQIDRFLLNYKGFGTHVNLISNIANLQHDDVFNKFHSSHQRAYRKSVKSNLKVEFNNDLDNFYPMLIENKKKFNTTPTHTYEELIKLAQLFPEDIKLLMAYHEGKPVAGVLLFVCNSTTVLAFYISHYFEYQELRAVNRLLTEAVLWSKENGYKWFDLGVSMDTLSTNPMEPSRKLIFFKEGFASRGFLRGTYHVKL